MDNATFKRIGRTLRELYSGLKQEILDAGVDLLSPEYDTLLSIGQEKIRDIVLARSGYTIEEYREAKARVEEEKNKPVTDLKEEVERIKQAPPIKVPTADEIADIAKGVIPAPQITQQTINQIVKETIVEKPTVVRETVVENNTFNEAYDDASLLAEIGYLNDRIDSLVIPAPLDEEKIKEDLKGYLSETLQKDTNINGMPDFRKLAMGLQAQIDELGEGGGGGGTWGSITGTLSAQTDLQTALDAKADDLGADDNYVTDAEKVVIGNTSGTNSGNVTLAGEDFLSLSGQQITANPIDLDNLSATGTPDSTTFLRGDNAWATPAGTDFSPDSIADINGWWKADAIAGLNDGDAITTWEDSSAAGFDLAQSTGSAKPTYKTSILNGQPIARFDGADYLSIASGPNPSGTAYTIFTVAKVTGGSGNQVIVSEDQNSSRGWASFESATTFIFESNGAQVGAVTKSVAGASQWDIMATRGGLTMWTGGILKQTVSNSVPAHTAEFHMGRRNYTGANAYLTGDIAEVIIYSRALTDAEMKQVNDYLGEKYALLSPVLGTTDSTGKVGIGLTAPLYKLDVYGGELAVRETSAGSGTLRIQDGTVIKSSGNYFTWNTGIRLNASGGKQLILGATAVDVTKEPCLVSDGSLRLYSNGYNMGLNIATDQDVGVRAGAATSLEAQVGGTIYQSTTTVSNGTTVETDLWSQSVAANTLQTGDSLHFRYAGTIQTSANNKQIKVKYGATTVFDSGAQNPAAAESFVIEGYIICTGVSTQKCWAKMSTTSGTLFTFANYTTAAETVTGAVTLKITGQGGASTEITFEGGKIDFEAAP